mgnify:CR=1 FL=1
MTHLPIVNTVDRFVLSATVPILTRTQMLKVKEKLTNFRIKTYPFSLP